ncbi:hypothetical protein NCS57_01003700 [Fusarium keratoplasticum]|uniref:Uncharacterized protein n=1 Tax=Fusarium keratoplasticum TaxID=1328300 RepID=A0ACC0QNR7_9HYPO|nr:hypothetical protein NCS57_01003700 [Fusarium keratoplasticum]KAI8660271.1 hypothetical protein NCS57_01003700 [Fusarium keratoplasticum]
MSEINKSLELTTTPSEAAEAMSTPNIDSAREARRKWEMAKQKKVKRDRTCTLHRNDYHAFLQFAVPGDMTRPEICQSHGRCKADGPLVTSRYRVCILAAKPRYFHPECFEDRYDVPYMIPRHFKMEAPEMCGLMVHKWFQHNRLVNLDAIAEYILQDCCYRLGMLEPDRPMPELKDYTTGTRDRCSLKDLVDNVMCGCFRKKALALAG